MSADLLRPVNYDTAETNVNNYRPAPNFGVMYDPETILNYMQNIFPQIIDQQPSKPAGYDWRVGFYFYKLNNVISFYVAPLLKPTDPGMPVLDCFNEDHRQYFKTDIYDSNGAEAFVYNEGALWP